MTQSDFDRLVQIHGLRGRVFEACRRVLVDGQTGYAVAKDMGIAESVISRALARLHRPVCKACNQPIRKK